MSFKTKMTTAYCGSIADSFSVEAVEKMILHALSAGKIILGYKVHIREFRNLREFKENLSPLGKIVHPLDRANVIYLAHLLSQKDNHRMVKLRLRKSSDIEESKDEYEKRNLEKYYSIVGNSTGEYMVLFILTDEYETYEIED